jgi:hypothetical protein
MITFSHLLIVAVPTAAGATFEIVTAAVALAVRIAVSSIATKGELITLVSSL